MWSKPPAAPWALAPHSVEDVTLLIGSCPLLVIVERETPDAAHTRHVGEDMSSPHACKCPPGQCSHGLSPPLRGRRPPQDARLMPRLRRHVRLCGRGGCVDRCRSTLAWRLGLGPPGGPPEGAALEMH